MFNPFFIMPDCENLLWIKMYDKVSFVLILLICLLSVTKIKLLFKWADKETLRYSDKQNHIIELAIM